MAESRGRDARPDGSRTLMDELEYGDVVCSLDTSSDVALTKLDVVRYSRQILLPEIAVAGQFAFRRARVLIVGAGGLGCAVAASLAGAGVGRIGVVDGDAVDASNLHRQFLHTEASAVEGLNKAEHFAQRLREMNSSVTVDVYPTFLTPENAHAIADPYSLIVDCTDNIPARYLLSDLAAGVGTFPPRRKPLVTGAALRWSGQATVYCAFEDTPCLRCVHPTPPVASGAQACSDVGVVGAVPSMIGHMQAIETLKIILQRPQADTLAGRLYVYSALDAIPRCVKLRSRQPNCVACTVDPSVRLASLAAGRVVTAPCGGGADADPTARKPPMAPAGDVAAPAPSTDEPVVQAGGEAGVPPVQLRDGVVASAGALDGKVGASPVEGDGGVGVCAVEGAGRVCVRSKGAPVASGPSKGTGGVGRGDNVVDVESPTGPSGKAGGHGGVVGAGSVWRMGDAVGAGTASVMVGFRGDQGLLTISSNGRGLRKLSNASGMKLDGSLYSLSGSSGMASRGRVSIGSGSRSEFASGTMVVDVRDPSQRAMACLDSRIESLCLGLPLSAWDDDTPRAVAKRAVQVGASKGL